MEASNNPLLQVVLSVIVLVALVFVLVRLVRSAKKGGKGLQAFGTAMMLFGFGSPKDPANDIVEQAEKLKRREEDNAGDPPAT